MGRCACDGGHCPCTFSLDFFFCIIDCGNIGKLPCAQHVWPMCDCRLPVGPVCLVANRRPDPVYNEIERFSSRGRTRRASEDTRGMHWMPPQITNVQKQSESLNRRHLVSAAGIEGSSVTRASCISRDTWRSSGDKSSHSFANSKHARPRCTPRHAPTHHHCQENGGAAEEPITAAMPGLFQLLSDEGHSSDAFLIRRLKQAILNGPRFDAAEADIARDLGLSARTLRRRLHCLETSYAQIIAEVRFAFAKQCLSDPQLTIGDVADRAGYTEVSNFRNAFKRWAHVSPQAFRDLIGLTQPGRASPLTQPITKASIGGRHLSARNTSKERPCLT
ncbi:hypothetical protein CA262_14370 [Sphingobium sp. GW456-12-10-14-TSB1]|jgi:AraC-like DNA-binding protein|nr:AraC family transcriptional regulator [Sphingobium sp.]OUC55917.1 hypothetical protein CA262_14370 [Sphingobium sp. GW456-12-10-14-TSB1]PZU56661.1 MAG: AraC family transcriptional regulator [Sphingobium sp.]RQW41760.1 AraC family transcriptional regulator [Novosphingobium sp. LASN5T]HCW59757.1 AraC family transcriptional regulator [Sphingobium sp.]